MPVLDRLINAKIDTMTKHLISSLRKGGVLHSKFYQSAVKFGQGYCPKLVSDEKAMEAGAELLVCYTLAGAAITGTVYSVKKYLDWHKNSTLEIEQLMQTSRQEIEQAMKQLREEIHSLQSMRGKAYVYQRESTIVED